MQAPRGQRGEGVPGVQNSTCGTRNPRRGAHVHYLSSAGWLSGQELVKKHYFFYQRQPCIHLRQYRSYVLARTHRKVPDRRDVEPPALVYCQPAATKLSELLNSFPDFLKRRWENFQYKSYRRKVKTNSGTWKCLCKKHKLRGSYSGYLGSIPSVERRYPGIAVIRIPRIQFQHMNVHIDLHLTYDSCLFALAPR